MRVNMSKKFFPGVERPIPYEGRESKNPLAFRYYNKLQRVGDKTMGEHLRFAVAYWHSFMGTGADMFGGPSFKREWHTAVDPMDRARETMDAAFEFCQKLGVDYYCFHDRDIAPEGESFSRTCRNLETMVQCALNLQKATGVKLLWGTANLFSNPVYSQGAILPPDGDRRTDRHRRRGVCTICVITE